MKKENQQVTFRRIGGRIVPIRLKTKDDKRRRNFGIGAVVAGVGVSAAGTRASYKVQEKAGKFSSMAAEAKIRAKWVSRRPLIYATTDPLFGWAAKNRARNKLLKIGRQAAKKAKFYRAAAPHFKTVGIWTGASLIGSGLARIFEAKDEDNLTGTFKELGFTAATAAALYGGGDKAIRAKVGYALAKILSKGKIK